MKKLIIITLLLIVSYSAKSQYNEKNNNRGFSNAEKNTDSARVARELRKKISDTTNTKDNENFSRLELKNDSTKKEKRELIMFSDSRRGNFYHKKLKDGRIHILPRNAMSTRSYIINGVALGAMTAVVVKILVKVATDFTIPQQH